jgi:hypothetical protein
MTQRDRILIGTASGVSYFIAAMVVRFVLGYDMLVAILVAPTVVFFATWAVYWRLKVPFWRKSRQKKPPTNWEEME